MKRIFPIGLIGLGILLIFGTLGWLYFDNLVNHPVAVPLPDQIAGLQMTDYTTGAQAAAQFENLHNKRIPLTSGAIGIYGDSEITLWAAGAPLNFMAARMVNAMEEKIAKENSPFTPLEQFTEGARTIYVLEGMGQIHYYFQSKNMIVWLAVDPSIADIAIQQILEAYP